MVQLSDQPREREKSFMPENDAIRTVSQEWVYKAENDLKNAVHTLKLGRNCPTDTVCFHAEQCVEKYLKAFLVLAEIEFPRTHDIEVLISLMPKRLGEFLTIEQQRRFTEYATVTRYPGPYEPIPLSEAKAAVKLARGVRRKILKLLEESPLF